MLGNNSTILKFVVCCKKYSILCKHLVIFLKSIVLVANSLAGDTPKSVSRIKRVKILGNKNLFLKISLFIKKL